MHHVRCSRCTGDGRFSRALRRSRAVRSVLGHSLPPNASVRRAPRQGASYEDFPDEEDIGPTFEDLTIDDSLPELERIERYSRSAIALQRLMHVKLVAATARREGFASTTTRLIPVLTALTDDVEFVVRQHVALQVPEVAEVCASWGEEGYSKVLGDILPLLSRLLFDSNSQVRVAAADSLVVAANLVRPEDQGQHVLTIVLQMAHEQEQEELRMLASRLLLELAPTLGDPLSRQFVGPEIASLAQDPMFRVRKSVALNVHHLCRAASDDLLHGKLLPMLHDLARDDIWGVRKACAECLVNVAEAVDVGTRTRVLLPMFEAFCADRSKWVRHAAYQNMGQFLVALPRARVTLRLLAHFVAMGGAGPMAAFDRDNGPALRALIAGTGADPEPEDDDEDEAGNEVEAEAEASGEGGAGSDPGAAADDCEGGVGSTQAESPGAAHAGAADAAAQSSPGVNAASSPGPASGAEATAASPDAVHTPPSRKGGTRGRGGSSSSSSNSNSSPAAGESGGSGKRSFAGAFSLRKRFPVPFGRRTALSSASGASDTGPVPSTPEEVMEALGVARSVMEGELTWSCAYAMPAIVQALGPERWPELRGAYRELCKAIPWKVRCTLAHSLHEVARMVGAAHAEADLMEPFELFVRDLDEVRFGVVKHMAAFLAALSPECREAQMPALSEVLDSCEAPEYWRFRLALASQLSAFTAVFSPAGTFSAVVPMLTRLIRDDVAAVRGECCKAASAVVQRFATSEQELQSHFQQRILALARARSYGDRQMFASLCAHLLRDLPRSLFDELFRDAFCALARDRVANVRLIVAETLRDGPQWLREDEDGAAALHILSHDTDRDVVLASGGQWAEATPEERQARNDALKQRYAPASPVARNGVEAPVSEEEEEGDEEGEMVVPAHLGGAPAAEPVVEANGDLQQPLSNGDAAAAADSGAGVAAEDVALEDLSVDGADSAASEGAGADGAATEEEEEEEGGAAARDGGEEEGADAQEPAADVISRAGDAEAASDAVQGGEEGPGAQIDAPVPAGEAEPCTAATAPGQGREREEGTDGADAAAEAEVESASSGPLPSEADSADAAVEGAREALVDATGPAAARRQDEL